jgi:deoxyadenosine/deoxycytidine kinase
MPRIALSGAIAVGKSTLCAELSQLHPSIEKNQEDVKEFRFLESFYQDPARFAFHSRMEFLAIKGAELARSPYSAEVATLFDRVLPELVTFARVMRASGLMSQREYLVYEAVWKILLDSLPQFDAFIWVRCDTATCLSRISARGRPFERGIDAAYLDALDAEYRRWRDEMSERYPVLSVDTTDGDQRLPRRVIDWLTSLGLVPAT